MRSLKGFDLFKKLPKDHFPQTAIGGGFTLLALGTMLALFLLELQVFLSGKVVKETLVDGTREEYIQVNVNITLHRAPCAMATLDIQDSAGGHELDVGNALKKVQFAVNGELKANQQLDESIPALEKAINQGDYCRFEGSFKVGSLPGNFHLSFHTPSTLFHYILDEDLRKVSLQHTLSHLSFGPEQHFLQSFEGNPLSFSPYDNLQVTYPEDGNVYNTEYFIKVIPMQFHDQSTGFSHSSYQYSMNFQSQKTDSAFGAIYFRYDIDCITVKYTSKSSSWVHFCISLCAIVGGAFTVIGIAHSLTQQTLKWARK